MTLRLPALSYRKGFARLYVVLAVAWIVAVVLVLPSHRLKFWIAPIDDSYATRVKESKAMASLPAGYILDHTLEWTKQHQIEEQVLDVAIKKYGGTPIQPPIDYDALAEQVRRGNPPKQAKAPGELTVISSEPLPPPVVRDDWFAANTPGADKPGFSESRTGKALWVLGLLFGPPIAGYLGLFGIVPWIYRGFNPAKQI